MNGIVPIPDSNKTMRRAGKIYRGVANSAAVEVTSPDLTDARSNP